MADLHRIYNNQPAATEAPLQHLDYSEQQYIVYALAAWKNDIAFWRSEFDTIPEPLPLHRSSRIVERQPLERYKSWIKEFRVDAQLASKIRQVTRKCRANPFHFHLAAFKTLLIRWLGTDDTCVMIADGSRRDERASQNQTFAECITEARDKSHKVLEHAVPLEIILNELAVARPATHTPLAQAIMNYAEVSVESRREFLGCSMEMMSEDHAELPYDIAFNVINNAEGETRIMLTVQQSIYTDEDAVLIAHGYEDILKEFVEMPKALIGDEFKFRDAALQKALDAGTGPAFESTWPQTLVHRFEELLPSIAERVAVTDCEENSLTYEQLSLRVNIIAAQLIHQGVKPGSRVAVFQHPSVHWVSSVLAILKVGAVYVPLDAGTPISRLALIVDDCQPTVMLVHEPTVSAARGLLLNFGIPVIDVGTLSDHSRGPIAILAEPDAPAIILYTSGSTGTPKGVILSHVSLKHEFDLCASTLQLGSDDVVLQQSAWSFDITVSQIFLAIGVGARLHVVSLYLRADSRAMADLIKNEGVTVTFATPTEYKSWLRREHQELLRATPSWRFALLGGEPVMEPLLQLFRDIDRPGRRLFNLYGPTETTCMSAMMELHYVSPGFYGSVIPVGRASANECCYILDTRQKLQPVGQIGEVVIGGVGVAMGYTNNAELTRASFIPNPFAPEEYVRRGWTTMYRTGDVGYLRDDGNLVLKGRARNDTEIKLNGVRIDLRDIEQTVLKAADGQLADAVASLRVDSGGDAKFMVVFVVFSSSTALREDKPRFLRNLLQDLPLAYTMRPSAVIPVDALPRTVGGKLDRKATASIPIHSQVLSKTYQPLLSQNEAMLRGVWRTVIPEELTELHTIKADSDFFSVGANSMQLMELEKSRNLMRFKLKPGK